VGRRGSGREEELTVAPFQPVVLADGVPTKTDAAMDGTRVGVRGDRGAHGVASCDTDEGQEDGSEDGGEP
jgi:hypothetical protein